MAIALVLVGSVTARAEPTADQLKASYDDTVRQLQQSQDRKNQLANENEQLKARIAELQSKLNAIDAQSKQGEFLRSQYVAWSTFMERYPLLLRRFQSFSRTVPAATVAPPQPFFDPEWPFSTAGRIEEETTAASPAASPTASLTVASDSPVNAAAPQSTTQPSAAPPAVTVGPGARGDSSAGSAPSTMPALAQMFHGGANHWCALCAAAAARKAATDKPTGEDLAAPTPTDLMEDLPPR